jgi:diguanylate cyclase (GGDEF)-like protein
VAAKTKELQEVNERLHRISIEDALTGAANRRRFDEVLEIEVRRGFRDAAPVSLVMVDIDHFKIVNDSYGHQTGDDCLVKVVQSLRCAVLRSTDIIARYGGEEFAVILPNTGGEAAAAIAESMRGFVQELTIPHAESPCQHLSISLGVATLVPGSPYRADDLVTLADCALYKAKREGRNRVISSDSVLVPKLLVPPR